MRFAVIDDQVNYHRQRRWLDILALKGALLGLVVILCYVALAHRSYRFSLAILRTCGSGLHSNQWY